MNAIFTDSYKWMEYESDKDPLIITVAVNGGIQGKELLDKIPETPDEIAIETCEAYKVGASVVHVHGRNPNNLAVCTEDPDVYREINYKIRAKCPDIIINNTTGAGMTTPMEARYRCLEAKPELASLNMGPDMSKFKLPPRKPPLLHPHNGWEFDGCIPFTYKSINKLIKIMIDNDIKPEMEMYHPGQYWVSRELIQQGLIKPPYLFQFVMGVQTSIFPTPWNLITMARELPDQSIFCVAGIGKYQWQMIAMSIMLSGHIRVGFEDNLYLKRGQKLKSNAEAVEKAVRIAKELNRPIATPAQAREIMGISPTSRIY